MKAALGCFLTVLGLLGLAACERSTAVGAAPATQGSTAMPTQAAPLQHTDAEWRKILTPEQYRVLRQKGTEPAFTGQYTDTTAAGTYKCAACGTALFTSTTKFHSGCGWPSFYAALAGDRVRLVPDYSHGMTRTEVLCAHCGGHLGHVFDDAPDQPTGQRYCINSVSLIFEPAAQTRPAK